MTSQKSIVDFELPYLPCSVNNYWRNSSTGRKVKTGTGLEFDEAFEAYKDLIPSFKSRAKMFHVELTFYVKDFYNIDGTLNQRAGDVDNLAKTILDKLTRHWGFDDFRIKSLWLRMRKGDNKTHIKFQTLKGSYEKIQHNRLN